MSGQQDKLKIKIKRVDTGLPLPKYHTKGSVGFDFVAREETAIKPGELAKIPGNLIIKTPPGYMMMLALRGSTPFRKGLFMAHGIGIGDQDFWGETDEYMIPVYNFTSEKVMVERGERIAQGIFVRVDTAEFVEVKKIRSKPRGGFGSTGAK